jgi:aminopeptidase N
LGEDDFRIGLQEYLKTFQYRNAVTEDLWEHLSKASNRNVSEMMSSWINQKGYPLVSISKNRYNQYLFSQQSFGGPPIDRKLWKIPLNLQWLNNDPVLDDLILEDNWSCFAVDQDQELVKANKSMNGFFRVHYHPSLDPILKDQIKNGSLNTLDKCDIFSGMFDLAKQGYDNTTRALDFLDCYLSETNYLIWNQIIQRLNTLKTVWRKHPNVSETVNKYYKRYLKSHLIDLGWDFTPKDTYQTMKMRQLIISTLAGIGEKSVLETCKKCFDEFVENPNCENSALNPNIRQSVLTSVVRFSKTKDEIFSLQEIFSQVESPEIQVEILKALGAVKDPDTLVNCLNFCYTSGNVRIQDMNYILFGIDPENYFVVWKYITINWDTLFSTFKDSGMGLLQVLICAPLTGLLDPKELMVAKEFIEEHLPELNNIKNAIQRQIEKVEKTIEWYNRDELDVVEWCNEFNKKYLQTE